MEPQHRIRAWLGTMALAIGLGLGACGPDEFEICRFEPHNCRGGLPGAFCDSDADCDGECCTDDDNCRGGMCTYECKVNRDCPGGMRCQHDICLYACDSDRDCARGQSCEHGNTVCEWP